MDGERFDAITKTLATGRVPRRTALRLLGSSALGGLLALLGLEEVAAACIPPGSKRRCSKGSDCCSRRCNRKKRRCRPCKSGTTFCTEKAACIPDGECCTGCGGDACANVDCDDGIACTVDSCDAATGACAHAPDHALCVPGFVCDPQSGCVCPVGQQECGGTCVDTATDPQHCGDCHRPCEVSNGVATCQAGICVFQCDAGFEPCSTSTGPGCCPTDPETNCTDGIDNDGDGATDHADSDCQQP